MDANPSEALISRLSSAKCAVAFTGAGISAESGVPTFRGPEGIWSRFKPEELANMEAFLRNPELVWEWYAHRKKIIAGVQPNLGHKTLAAMEKHFPDFFVITQNIDNLHRRAGSTRIYELHGNIERNYCMRCRTIYHDIDFPGKMSVPKCDKCGGLIRPDVVWFGEMLPQDKWSGAVEATESAEVFFSIGTSGEVYPAASLPSLAKRQGAFVVEINPNPTPITSYADESLMAASGAVLPLIWERLTGNKIQPE